MCCLCLQMAYLCEYQEAGTLQGWDSLFSLVHVMFIPRFHFVNCFQDSWIKQFSRNTLKWIKCECRKCIIFTSILSPISKGNIFIEKIKCLMFFWCLMMVVIAAISALLCCTFAPKPSTTAGGLHVNLRLWLLLSAPRTSPSLLLPSLSLWSWDRSHLLFLWRTLQHKFKVHLHRMGLPRWHRGKESTWNAGWSLGQEDFRRN